ncbi:MAG: pilus assembly protein TadG-related protein [Actinomycetota bacterium]
MNSVVDRDQRNEKGAVLIIVVLAITGLLGMVALVVDVGALLSMKRRVVTAADAAALAAAQACAKPYESGAAQSQANDLAARNVSSAEVVSFSATGCGVSDSGEVRVSYKAPQQLYFAAIIGGPNGVDVSAQASARWGVAKAANPVPFGINSTDLRACGVPLAPVGTECAFWHDPGDLGNAQFRVLDFNQWDEAAGDDCSRPRANRMRQWMDRGFPTPLSLNYPAPTYVCAVESVQTSVWSSLRGRTGAVLHIPVNNPAGQVDRNGSLAPPPQIAHKHSIIGFTPLRVIELMDGDDPDAVGQLTREADCSGPTDLDPLEQFLLDATGCYVPPATISNLKLAKGDVVFTEGVDYIFDPVTRTVQWIGAEPVNNVTVSFHWTQLGFAGRCGMRAPNADAKCLVVEWTGSRTGGFDPRGGANFGLFAVRLSQ